MPLEAQRHSALHTFEGLSYDVHDEMSFEVFQQVMRNPGAALQAFFRRCEKQSIIPLVGLSNSIATLWFRRNTPAETGVRASFDAVEVCLDLNCCRCCFMLRDAMCRVPAEHICTAPI